MAPAGKQEVLLIDAGSLDPAESHLSGLPVVSILLSGRERTRLLKKAGGNGHSHHLALLVKPTEPDTFPTSQPFLHAASMPGFEKADFGKISNFKKIRVSEGTFRGLREDTVANAALFPGASNLKPNTCCIIQDGKNTALAIYKRAVGLFVHVSDPYTITGKMSPLTAEMAFAWHMLHDDTIPVVALWGPAGSGKSSAAIHCAINQILQRKFDQLLVLKSMQQAKEQTPFAAVPGDSRKKFADQRRVVEETILDIRKAFPQLSSPPKKNGGSKGAGQADIHQSIDFGFPVDIFPPNNIRGGNWRKKIVIAEESQNFTPDNILLIGTRLAEGSKFVVIGDKRQVDHPRYNEDTNGLSDMIKKLSGEEEFGQVNLTKCLRKGVAALFVRKYYAD